MQQKIDGAIEDSGGILKLVTTLKKIVFYAEQICRFVNIFENIVATWQLVTVTLGKAEAASITNPIAYAALHPPRVSTCVTTETTNKALVDSFPTLHKFCNFVTCKQSPGDFGKGGWTSWIGQWQSLGEGFLNDVGGITIKEWTANADMKPKELKDYMNPKGSIVVATLTACIPGIIYGLDKYRQIQCMYADCLQTGVGKQGLPVSACEDEKSYATCKYVIGEVFQVLPYTALFNYYINKIKDTLSNPFKILGAVLALSCYETCPAPTEDPHTFCRAVKIVSLLGETVDDVKSIIDQGAFTIKEDYCGRLQKSESKSTISGGSI